jgi:hypothetical protein
VVVTQQREPRAKQADLAVEKKAHIDALASRPVRVQHDKQMTSEMDSIRQAMQALDQGTNVGRDDDTPEAEDYKLPFACTGTIGKFEIRLRLGTAWHRRIRA